MVATVAAQQPAPTLTLSQAVGKALKNYPSIRVSQEQMNVAAAGIQLARTAYLPRVDALAQINRGTRNNVFGLLLPQSVIPSISGPVIGSNNLGSVWGSAVGVRKRAYPRPKTSRGGAGPGLIPAAGDPGCRSDNASAERPGGVSANHCAHRRYSHGWSIRALSWALQAIQFC